MAIFKRFLTSPKPLHPMVSNNPFASQRFELFNPKDPFLIETSPAMISPDGTIKESLHMVQGGRGSMALPVISSGEQLPVVKSVTLVTTCDFQESIDIFLFQGKSLQTSRNAYLGAYRINGLCAMGRGG